MASHDYRPTRSSIPLDSGARHRLILRGPHCERDSAQGEQLRQEMLRLIMDSPDHLRPAASRPGFDRMQLEHDGMCWVARLEADEEKKS